MVILLEKYDKLIKWYTVIGQPRAYKIVKINSTSTSYNNKMVFTPSLHFNTHKGNFSAEWALDTLRTFCWQ